MGMLSFPKLLQKSKNYKQELNVYEEQTMKINRIKPSLLLLAEKAHV